MCENHALIATCFMEIMQRGSHNYSESVDCTQLAVFVHVHAFVVVVLSPPAVLRKGFVWFTNPGLRGKGHSVHSARGGTPFLAKKQHCFRPLC